MDKIDDGGQAFPCLPPQDTAAGSAAGYPFPEAGMSLRDYFAAKAMAALIVASPEKERTVLAILAWRFADVMLRERKINQ